MITSGPVGVFLPHVDEPDGGHGPIEDAPVERGVRVLPETAF
jgi:hypothetical protein